MANVSKLKINNVDPAYDIKDALARQVIDKLGGDSASTIASDLAAAVGNNSTQYETVDDVVKALANLNSKTLGAVGDVNVTKGNDNLITISVTRVDGSTDDPIRTDIASQAYVDQKFVGASKFRGVVNAYSGITVPYDAGDYWVVGTAGTYAGQSCEIGDFIYATTAKASGGTKADSDFKVVQANIDPSVYAQKAGGTKEENGNIVPDYANPQPFTGVNTVINITSSSPNGQIANKKYVDDAVSGAVGNDKLQDYYLIPVSSAATLGSTTNLSSATIASINTARAANKIPLLWITFTGLSNAEAVIPLCPVEVQGHDAFVGSVSMVYNDKPVNGYAVVATYPSETGTLNLSYAPVTSVTTATDSISDTTMSASYTAATETIAWAQSTVTTKTFVTGVTAS